MFGWLKKLFCAHEMYLEDMNRLSDDLVVGYCHKCKKRFANTHGLAFGVKFAHRPLGPESEKSRLT
jgi:hypothetical protein